MQSKPLISAQIWSASLGNFFEHYDAALFGFLSLFLAPLIFSQQDLITALILTYAMIPLGMLARPFGALFFGYIGDIYGRKNALYLTLGGMSIVSAYIAISPTYEQIGILASVYFCLGRIMQNFFASGETMGGAIYLLENTPESRHDMLSSLYNASTIGGILFASTLVSLLSYYDIVDSYWRLLYVLGCLTALFGFFFRTKIPPNIETYQPKKFMVSISTQMKIFWDHRYILSLVILTSGFSYATYSVALILMNAFVPLVSDLSNVQMISLNTALLVLDFALMPIFGWLSSKFSREKIMFLASFGTVIIAVPSFLLLDGASLTTVIGIRISFVLFGVAFCAPFHAWAQEMVPKDYRYSIISFGYAVGTQLLGGPTAAISLWMFKTTEIMSSVSWYWLSLAIINSLIFGRLIIKARGNWQTIKQQDI